MALEIEYLPANAQLPEEICSGRKKFRRKMLHGKYFYVEEFADTCLDVPPPFFEFEPTGLEPRQIVIGDRTYRLHRERLYVPEHPTPMEVESLFDFLAESGYEQRFIDLEFNTLVYHRLFDLALKGREALESPLILDYGCGTGIGALAAPEYHRKVNLIGVDISQEMVRLSRKNGLAALGIGYDEDLPFRSRSFDGAIMAFVSNFLPDAQPYQRIHRVLKRHARIAFNLYRPTGAFQKHYSRVLRESGFVNARFSLSRLSSSSITRDIWFVVGERPY